jgi:murein L,D-transpeptidase YafK
MTSQPFSRIVGHVSRFALAAATVGLLSACQDTGTTSNSRAYQPLSNEVLDLMAEKGTNERAPVLIRAYKKEAELEIWKMKDDGKYTLLKTYPMCRWSGQLGPKTREGDRQVPEGFYTITPGQMNPNSAYYLSFNVGYPNAYDKAHNYTGGEIMVHGICSSAGCFSMTDQQIAEIYAIAREAFGGGQRAIQMESLPFHMTAENLAKYRLDPNIGFWKELKKGVDDFDVTLREPKVDVCGRHYVFDENPIDPHTRLDPAAACPPLKPDATIAQAVAQKEAQDDSAVAQLVASGVKPIHTVYDDGGQNPQFASQSLEESRPEALARGPIDVVLGPNGRPLPSPSEAPATKLASKTTDEGHTTALMKTKVGSAPAAVPASVSAYAPQQAAAADDSVPFYKRWLGLAPEPAPSAAPAPTIPQTTIVPAAPSPPHRQAVNSATSKPPVHKPAPPADAHVAPTAYLRPTTHSVEPQTASLVSEP